MFRLANVCKQTPALHSRREIPSLSNGCSIRNVSFKVRPAEDLEWRNYRSGVLKVVMECKKVNREKLYLERRKQKIYDEEYSFENLFGSSFKFAEEVNRKQQERREKLESERTETAMKMEEEQKPIMKLELIEKEKKLEKIFKVEKEKSEKFILQSNIENCIEETMDNPVSNNFGFPFTKVVGNGRGQRNFDQKGEVILHELVPDVS